MPSARLACGRWRDCLPYGTTQICQWRWCCARNLALLDLLVFAIAAGLPVLQVVLAAANVPEFGELPVQGETHIHNAVSIVARRSVCFGRNAQSVEQLMCCLHLGAVVVAV